MREIERQMLGALATVARQWGAVPADGQVAERVGLDIEDSEIRIIYLLGARTSELRPADVADMLGVTRPTLSKSLTRLRNAHLIESTVTEQDRRSVYVSLSEEGRDAYRRLVDLGIGLIDEANADMSKEELRLVGNFLDRFVRGLGGPAPIVLPPVPR
ncbi:MarR family winged helix-turn-helix transcriptional regulator [Leucobacter aridicollis]|uniref:DNA-binding MarR family transcriptional regulator n=1 Tax=Leucobacter aridicollis TaxID=283878 RepID=A0A852QZG0_9MICO|nr:MarR family transcriptional regulator [Leucobacter aridicollis]MBL3682199.1 MarR family transcriptional regulator [Leucobacter aridicollis]NYD26751.1 DNA-binding MarR family transcriptional regulator [Leucobacter aridicollis]